MTERFQPPAPSSRVNFARDLFRLGPRDDPYWVEVRAAQLRFLLRHMPFNIAVVVTNGAVALAALAHKVEPSVLLMWFLMNTGMLALWGVRAARARHSGRPASATPDFLRRVTCEMSVVGLAWGILFVVVLPRLETGDAMLVIAMMMTAVGCAAFTSSIFPLGAVALAAPVMLGTLLGILMTDWPDAHLIGTVVFSFILIVVRSNIMSTAFFLGRLRARMEVRAQAEVVRLLLNEFEANGQDWLFEFDARGRLQFVSSRFSTVVHCPTEQLVGTCWRRFLVDRESAAPVIASVRAGRPFRNCLLKVEIAGVTHWWNVSGTPKSDDSGRLLGYRGVGSDVTEHQLAAQRIADLATFDALTGLVNRRIVHKAIADGLRSPAGVILLFIDLDRFKTINDSLGHGEGDRLLAEVAQRLRALVGTEGLVGRLGGDEFAVVLRGGDVEGAIHLGNSIIARLSEPYRLGEARAIIGASIGLAQGPLDGDNVETLMRAADLALYDAKEKGRGNVRPYNREMHRRAEERRSLELDLRNALDEGQLRLAFQPIVDARDERIVGFEALMRWRHPVQGDIPPALFIPIAEEAGLIGQLGNWALDEACRVASRWPAHIRLSVNLSPMQFEDPGLADHVEQVLRRWNIAPQRLELELTENLFLNQRARTRLLLDRLRRLGVGMALDDFGTGYASLGYVRQIDFTRIKIDRSFVQASLRDDGESATIIQAIVAMAGQLGLETTAEGAETRAEFEAMRNLGCAHVQGYYFGRPMDANDTCRLLSHTRASPEIPLCALMLPPNIEAGHGQWQTGSAHTIPPPH